MLKVTQQGAAVPDGGRSLISTIAALLVICDRQLTTRPHKTAKKLDAFVGRHNAETETDTKSIDYWRRYLDIEVR